MLTTLRLLSWLAFFFHLLLCTLGYYQHPEVVQFTEVPSDAVVCEGCRLEMSCSILQQETAANLPQPELEWIFNGRRLSEAFPDVRVLPSPTATHLSLTLTVENTRAEHGGTYQCRATDGSNSTLCGAGTNSIRCNTTTTISKPARIQIVGDTVMTETVSIGSSCSGGVAVLPCSSRLMQATALETLNLNLTWRRNGLDFIPDSDSELVMLSSGDLVMTTTSSDNMGLYECVVVFSIASYRNITLTRYNVAYSEPLSAGSGSSSWFEDVTWGSTPDYSMRLTSSRVVVYEGGSVEFVCEASVSQGMEEGEPQGEEGEQEGQGQCVPYNVTWSVVSSGGGSDGSALRPVVAQVVNSDNSSSSSSLALLNNNHLLRVGGVSRGSSQYCCQVHAAATGHRIAQECTSIHVVPQKDVQAVDPKTVFLKSENEPNITNISCSIPASAGSHGNVTWYHNGDLIEGFNGSYLSLGEGDSSRESVVGGDDVYGVYQCFSDNGLSVREASLVRVLPYGLTNPPGEAMLVREIPHPSPSNPTVYGSYLISWRPPLFTGGLNQLQYNITVTIPFYEYPFPPLNTNLTSVIVHLGTQDYSRIIVSVVNTTATNQQISEATHISVPVSPASECAGKVLYPPSPSLSCMGGLVNLSWMSTPKNAALFLKGGTELEYVNGSCTHPNGSTDQHHTDLERSPRVLYENGVAVGTHCRLAMGSVKERPNTCVTDCFCYDTNQIMYSQPVECYVQGYVQFVNSTYQAFESDGSFEVCVQAEGYGFTVNVSAVGESDITPSISHQINFSSSTQDILCVYISILDDNIIEGARTFNIVLTTDNELVTVGDPATVNVTDDCTSDHSTGPTAMILGVVFGVIVFFVILTVAGSISCLVILVRRKRNSYRIPQDDIGSIDWNVEPAVLISPDNLYFHHVKQYSESDFDSQTLLDYLGPTSANLSTTVTLTSVVPPLQILSTRINQDTMDDGDTPQETHKQKQFKLEELHHSTQRLHHQTNCYNVSVESGVVLDADSQVNLRRKISAGSGSAAESCSQGSSSHDMFFEHSYIGMADSDVCACTECREQRERLYSKRPVGGRTLVTTSESSRPPNKMSDASRSTTCAVDGSQPKNSDKLQCHTTTYTMEDNRPTGSDGQCSTNDSRPRGTESSSHSHETGGNSNDCDTTEPANSISAVHHPPALNQDARQPIHACIDVRSHRVSKDD